MTFARTTHVPSMLHTTGHIAPYALARKQSLNMTQIHALFEAIRVAVYSSGMRDAQTPGATNTKALQARWRIRRAAYENEPAWLENFHRDPR